MIAVAVVLVCTGAIFAACTPTEPVIGCNWSKYPNQTVCVYRDDNFSGNIYSFNGSDAQHNNNVYDLLNHGQQESVNDSVSSIVSASNEYAVFFEDAGYSGYDGGGAFGGTQGVCLKPGHSVASLSPPLDLGFSTNDEISSHKLYTELELYQAGWRPGNCL